MKKLLILYICLNNYPVFSQNNMTHHFGVMPIVEGKICYSEIISVDSVSASELYNRAKRFLAIKYKSAQDVIQLDSKETGEIIAKGSMKESWQSSWMSVEQTYVRHTLSLQFKDGRFRYVMNDFQISYSYYDTNYNRTVSVDMELQKWNLVRKDNLRKFLEPLNADILAFIESLKQAMNSPSSSLNAGEDW